METVTLIDELERGAGILREAVAGMPPQDLTARPVSGRWSTLEVVCHLADFDIVGADRIKRVIAEHEPALPVCDENAFTARLEAPPAPGGVRIDRLRPGGK